MFKDSFHVFLKLAMDFLLERWRHVFPRPARPSSPKRSDAGPGLGVSLRSCKLTEKYGCFHGSLRESDLQMPTFPYLCLNTLQQISDTTNKSLCHALTIGCVDSPLLCSSSSSWCLEFQCQLTWQVWAISQHVFWQSQQPKRSSPKLTWPSNLAMGNPTQDPLPHEPAHFPLLQAGLSKKHDLDGNRKCCFKSLKKLNKFLNPTKRNNSFQQNDQQLAE